MSLTKEKSVSIPEKSEPVPWLWCYKQDQDGDTMLHLWVAAYPKYEIQIEKLLQLTTHPALLNIPNRDGVTVLNLAAMTTFSVIVRKLMSAGASPEMRNHSGWTPLHHACQTGDVKVIEALTSPYTLEEKNNISRFAYIPDVLWALYARNFEGQTPLHIAVENGHLGAVKLLTSLGATMDTTSRNGRTPLKIAIERKDKPMTRFILHYFERNPDKYMQNVLYYGFGEPLKEMGFEEKFLKTLKMSKSQIYLDSSNESD